MKIVTNEPTRGLDAIGPAIESLAAQIMYLGTGRNGSQMGAVEFLAVQTRDGLESVADAIRELARAMDGGPGPRSQSAEAPDATSDDALVPFLDAWYAAFGSRWLAARQLVPFSMEHGLWGPMTGTEDHASLPIRIGKILARTPDRIGPYRILRRRDTHNHGWRWALVRVEDQEPGKTPTAEAAR